MYNTCCLFLDSAKPAMPCTVTSLKRMHFCCCYCSGSCISQCKFILSFCLPFKTLVMHTFFLLHRNASWFCKTLFVMFQASKKCLSAMLFSPPLWSDGLTSRCPSLSKTFLRNNIAPALHCFLQCSFFPVKGWCCSESMVWLPIVPMWDWVCYFECSSVSSSGRSVV